MSMTLNKKLGNVPKKDKEQEKREPGEGFVVRGCYVEYTRKRTHENRAG